MNGAVEDLLREGLDRLTADVQVPAGVTGRARSHVRRKKLAARAALAGGAAAVTAVAVVAATVPGQDTTGTIQARTAAYVLTRVANALATTNKVVQITTTFSAPFPQVRGWTYANGFSMRQSGYIAPAQDPGMPWAQGRVSWGAGSALVGGKKIYVQVDYRHHEWYRTGTMGFLPNGCTTRLDIVEFNGPSDWAQYLRQALSCGTFKVTGHAWIGGIRTVKLSGSQSDPSLWNGSPQTPRPGPLRVDVTFYVDQATYFPVLAVWRNSSHGPDGKVLRGTVRQVVSLLPPTPANKAKAEVTVPASFRRVHGAPFGGPVWPYFTSP